MQLVLAVVAPAPSQQTAAGGVGHWAGAAGQCLALGQGLERPLGTCSAAHMSHWGPAPLFSLQHSDLGAQFAVVEERLQLSLALDR